MSYKNPFKNMLQNAVNSFKNILTGIESNSKSLTDDQMECMQFGICSFVPKTLEEIPYFHF